MWLPIIMLVVLIGAGAYLLITYNLSLKLPEGYTLHLEEKGSEFEKIASYDTQGMRCDSYYTKIYGFAGAERRAIISANERAKFLASYSEKLDDFEKRYEQ